MNPSAMWTPKRLACIIGCKKFKQKGVLTMPPPNYGENLREQLLENALRETGNEKKLAEINEIMIKFYAGKKVALPVKPDVDE